jgi:Nicotianamine synthase protein
VTEAEEFNFNSKNEINQVELQHLQTLPSKDEAKFRMQKYIPSCLRLGKDWKASNSEASSFASLPHSEDQDDSEANQLVTHIIGLHTKLSSLPDLTPCEKVNTLFEELVGLCTQTVSESVVLEVREPRQVQND